MVSEKRYDSGSQPPDRALRLLALKEALTEEATTMEALIVVKIFKVGGMRESWRVLTGFGMGRRGNAAGLYILRAHGHCPSLAVTGVLSSLGENTS